MSVDIDNKFKRLIKDLCYNVQRFPPESIQKGVILLSLGNMANQSAHSDLFDHLSQHSRLSNQKSSISASKIDENVLLIDPTRKMLQPGEGCGFVNQHYLLRSMKQAKFIFVLYEAHTEKPIKLFTDTLLMFSKFFKTQRGISKLGDSCGIVILDSTFNEQIVKAKLYTSGVNENGFINQKNRSLVQLCQQIFTKKNVHLMSRFTTCKERKEYTLKAPFLEFLKRIQYYDLRSQIADKLYFNTSLPVSDTYPQFDCNQNNGIYKSAFQQILRSFLQNIDAVIDNKREQVKQSEIVLARVPYSQIVQKYGEAGLVRIINSVDWDTSFKKEDKKCSITKPESQKLALFLSDYLEAFSEKDQHGIKTERNLKIQKILTSMFENGYLKNREIQRFFLSSKHFMRCFPKILVQQTQQDRYIFDERQLNISLILRNQVESFQSIIYKLIFRLIDLLYEDIKTKIPLAFDTYLCFFVDIKLKVKGGAQAYKFFSNRMLKKLQKCHAQLAYQKAKRSQMPKDWLYFIGLATKNTLIQEEKKQEAFMIVGSELEKKGQWRLALKIYEQVSIFKSYQKIIAIYEKKYRFAPEVMKYFKEANLVNCLQDFIKYCQFLMKIGFNEKVREICFEGLRLSNDPSLKEELQSLLINARGDNYKSLHHKFLEEVLIEKIPIIYDEDLINEVERKFVV